MLPVAAARARPHAAAPAPASGTVRGSYLPRYNQRAEAFEHRFPASRVAQRVNPTVLRRTLTNAARAELPPPGSLSETMRWYGERKDMVGALHVFEEAAKTNKVSVEEWGTFLRVCDSLFPSKIRFYNYGMKKFLEEEKNPKKVLDFAAIMQAAGDTPDDMTKELVKRAKTELGIAADEAAPAAAPAAANKPEQKT